MFTFLKDNKSFGRQFTRLAFSFSSVVSKLVLRTVFGWFGTGYRASTLWTLFLIERVFPAVMTLKETSHFRPLLSYKTNISRATL